MSSSLSIDIGSTTTVVAFHDGYHSKFQTLKIPPFSDNKSKVIPSIIWVKDRDDAQPLIGRQVLDAGLDIQEQPNLQRDFKRWIGSYQTNTQKDIILHPEEAGELLLFKIWTHLPKNIIPNRLILTAPIDGENRYRDYRRWLIEATASLAINEVALVDEPTAAAIGANLPPGSIVLVIDLGGSTIDLALVKLQGGEGRAAPLPQLLHFGGRALIKNNQKLGCAEVLSKVGLPLGGRDIDFWIASEIAPNEIRQPSLLKVSERLKCQLSNSRSSKEIWLSDQRSTTIKELSLDRVTLDNLLQERGLLQALDGLLERVLAAGKKHGLKASQIDAILPVGGTARIPTVQRWLQERCGYWPLLDENPIEAVACGALSLIPSIDLKDVLNRGVSLCCWDQRSSSHRWYTLFIAGQSWPTSSPLSVILACGIDDQSIMTLEFGEPTIDQNVEIIYRNNSPELQTNLKNNNTIKLWKGTPLRIHLEPPGKSGQDRLSLSFVINPLGQLILNGKDMISEQIIGPVVLGFVR
uniref:Putative DnaK-type molecular chaperone (HSP70 family protein) n=1 Tax=Paulinella chromatophora TaxID=39717 RepID=B1X401_PAUCH|nr:putative DnaK-type molecular chaperone (HSP70 family protein) [Paulinella chromatophora]ACB42670.1 putative DnaK-type molecular chaperone (HSP70 family protein) [Paulinella chromatophora]